jgi:hypothetical protein
MLTHSRRNLPDIDQSALQSLLVFARGFQPGVEFASAEQVTGSIYDYGTDNGLDRIWSHPSWFR